MNVPCPRALLALTVAAAIAGCARPAAPAAGAPNAPVAALTADQQAQIDAAGKLVAPARRAHLRYAFPTDDAGKPQFVVYDDLGLGAGGKTGRKSEYIVFRVLNRADGSHYDPQQNALVAAIPPPRDRDLTLIPR